MTPTAILMMVYRGILRILLVRISVEERGVALIVYIITFGAIGKPYALARRAVLRFL